MKKLGVVILILADDLGSKSTSLYPDLYNPSAPSAYDQTPNPKLSAPASWGIVFDTVCAAPWCSPTRATILSRLYAHNTGVTTAGNILPGSTISLFERLAAKVSPHDNIAAFGKWHLAASAAGPNGMDHVDVGGRPAGSPTVHNGAVPVYRAIIQALDTEMGRLFRAMDEAGQRQYAKC